MKYFIKLTLGCWIFLVLWAPAGFAQSGDIVLTNVNIIDGLNNEVLKEHSIVISDGVIQAVVPDEDELSGDARIIDLDNRFVLPGLIDAHAHVNSLENAERALTYGTTTIRSASVGSYADVAMQQLVREGRMAGPELIPAGVFVQPDLGEDVLADPELAGLYDGVTTEEALRELVRINVENGVQFIKTRSAERAGTPDTDPRKQVYTEDQIRVVVEEASRHDVPVMAHAHGSVGAAVRAGVRSIEHGTYATGEELDLMKEKGTFLVPTYSTVLDLTMPGGDYDHPVTTIRGQHMLPQMESMVRKAMEKEVKIVSSTDSGYGPESINRVPTEVINFVKLGMTPFEAIRSATAIAADLLQISDRTGTVEAGKEADLIVLYDNPLEDIRALQDVIMVISNGEVVHNRLPFEKEE